MLCVIGVADGIRDEYYMSSEEGGSEGAMLSVRSIVVEMKNRVGGKFRQPLYDLMQLAIYCVMHGVEEGELVECVRGEGGEKGGGDVQIKATR